MIATSVKLKVFFKSIQPTEMIQQMKKLKIKLKKTI